MDNEWVHNVRGLIKKVKTIRNGVIEIAQKSIKEAEKEVPKIQERVHKRFLPEQRRIAKEQFTESVDEYYRDYEPKRYKRRKSLYSGWKYELDQQLNKYGSLHYDEAYDLLDPKNAMTVTRNYRNDNGNFFRQMYFEGWHGGAMTISGDKAEEWWPHPEDSRVAYWRGAGRKVDGSMHRFGVWLSPAENFASTHSGKTPYEYFEESLDAAQVIYMMPIFEQIEEEESEYLADYIEKEIIAGVDAIFEQF